MFQAHLTIRATTPLREWLMGRNSSDHKSPFSGTMPGPELPYKYDNVGNDHNNPPIC